MGLRFDYPAGATLGLTQLTPGHGIGDIPIPLSSSVVRRTRPESQFPIYGRVCYTGLTSPLYIATDILGYGGNSPEVPSPGNLPAKK